MTTSTTIPTTIPTIIKSSSISPLSSLSSLPTTSLIDALYPSISSRPDSSTASTAALASFPSLDTKGAHGELQSIKQSTKQNQFSRFVGLYSMATKWRTKSKCKKLTHDELNECQTNFNRLKFESEDVGVHHKVLSRSFYKCQVFSTLEASVKFIEEIFENSKYITFQELLLHSKSNDSILYYMFQLAKEQEIPKPSFHKKTKPEEKKLFLTQPLGTLGSYRLALIPRQKQTVIPLVQDHNHDHKEFQNHSLRRSKASPPPPSLLPRSDSNSTYRAHAGKCDENGYSYRNNSGAKCGKVTIITHSQHN